MEFSIVTNWFSKVISILKQWKLAQLFKWENAKNREHHGADLFWKNYSSFFGVEVTRFYRMMSVTVSTRVNTLHHHILFLMG